MTTTIHRSYVRCMRDGMAYALRHFMRQLSLLRYALPIFVVATLLLLAAKDGWQLGLLLRPERAAFPWAMLGAAVLVFVAGIAMLTQLTAYQKRTLLRPEAAEELPAPTWRERLQDALRVALVVVMQGLAAALVVVVLGALATAAAWLLHNIHWLVQLLVGCVLALLGIAMILVVMSLMRLLFMQYIYEPTSLAQSIRQAAGLRKHISRVAIVEVISACVMGATMLIFATPVFIMEYVRELSLLATINQEAGAALPDYFDALRYGAMALAALGGAFGIVLTIHPIALNWQAIRAEEEA